MGASAHDWTLLTGKEATHRVAPRSGEQQVFNAPDCQRKVTAFAWIVNDKAPKLVVRNYEYRAALSSIVSDLDGIWDYQCGAHEIELF